MDAALLNISTIFRIALLCLLIPLAACATGSLNGSGADDAIIGTPQDDELNGRDGDDSIDGLAGDDLLEGGAGDDQLDGGRGDDVLIGGAGFDILFGGAGSDRFVIDVEKDAPDVIWDFDPDEGDTVFLRFRLAPERKLNEIEIKNIRLNTRGDVTVRLVDEEQFEVLQLKRSDLKLEVDDFGDDVRLIFTKKLD